MQIIIYEMIWNILPFLILIFLRAGQGTGEELAEEGQPDMLMNELEEIANPKRQHWSFGLRPGKRSSPPMFGSTFDDYFDWLDEAYTKAEELDKNQNMDRMRNYHLIPNYSLQGNEDSMAVDERQHWSIGLRPAGKRSQATRFEEEKVHNKISYILSQLLSKAGRSRL